MAPASVDEDILTGHSPACITGEEQCHVGDFIRLV